MIYLKHWLPCLFAKMALLATWKGVTWRKSNNNGSLFTLNKLQNLVHPPHLVVSEHEKRMQTEPRNKDFQVLSWLPCTGDICLSLSLASVFISKMLQEHAYMIVIYMVSLLGVLLLWCIPWLQTAWRRKDLFADTSTSPISREVREGAKGKDLIQQSME